jgi:NADH-quinone oxidoreductase subunit B
VPQTAAYDSKIEGNVIFTQLDAAMNWMRKNSLWPMPMGLACCAIELMATAASRFDIARFGSEVMRFSPRQCDVMIVAGTVTYKMALAVKRIWEQMPEPKWCIAMGACASSGGMYRSYAVLQGIDQLIPVDVYVSGCPPRPEALLEGLIRLQKKIEREPAFLNQKPKLVHELIPETERGTVPRPSIGGGVPGAAPSTSSLA